MSDPLSHLRQFLAELKRRKVYRVAVTYLVAAFVVVQLADLAAGAFGLPGWFEPMVWVVCGLGFPLAVVLAWAFAITPEGVRREEVSDEGEAGSPAFVWAGLTLVAVVGIAAWYVAADEGGGPPSDGAAAGPAAQTESASAAASASASTASLPERDRPFVAVLPLENLSPSEENAFFADGIHEEILTQLSKVSGVGVFARTTMRQYEGAEMTVSEIARELGADAVLEGSVRRAGDQVRITVQLIDPESRDHAWAETYQRTLSPDAIFDIQSRIAGRIASALEAEMSSAERGRIADAPTSDLAAYDAYLRGRTHLSDFYSAGFDLRLVDSATVDLERSIEADPEFAEALGLLSYAHAIHFAYTMGEDQRNAALEAAARADSLGEEVVGAHLGRAMIFQQTGRPGEALDELARVLALRPDHSLALVESARAHMVYGDLSEGLSRGLRAVRHDPRNIGALQFVGGALYRLGFLEEARAWVRMGRRHDPGSSRLAALEAAILRSQGRRERAREVLETHLERGSPGPVALSQLARIELEDGNLDRARELLERRLELVRDRTGGAAGTTMARARSELGYAYLELGREEEGRALLERAARSLRREIETGPLPGEYAWLVMVESALGDVPAARENAESVEGPTISASNLDHPMLEGVRNEPWFDDLTRRIEKAHQRERQEALRMEWDLWPPDRGAR